MNQLLVQKWDQLGQEEKVKYCKMGKPRLGDYFGNVKKVELYKTGQMSQEESVEFESPHDSVPLTKNSMNSEDSNDGAKFKTEEDEVSILNNEDSVAEDDSTAKLESLYPNVSISNPAAAVDACE